MPILNEDFVINNEAKAVTEPTDGNDGNHHNDDNIPGVKLRSHFTVFAPFLSPTPVILVIYFNAVFKHHHKDPFIRL